MKIKTKFIKDLQNSEGYNSESFVPVSDGGVTKKLKESELAPVRSFNGRIGDVEFTQDDFDSKLSIHTNPSASVDPHPQYLRSAVAFPVKSVQAVDKFGAISPIQYGNIFLNVSDFGLDQVDNTSDLNKPISNNTQNALDLKSDINNSHLTGTTVIDNLSVSGSVSGIDKSDVGLDQVDNTSDLNKPISNNTQNALDLKSDINNSHLTGTTVIDNLSVSGSVSGIDYNMLEGDINYISLNNAPTIPAFKEGNSYWDNENKCISTQLTQDVTLQNGQEIHVYVSNISGSTITNGTVVYIDTHNNGYPTIQKTNNTETMESHVLGVATQDILNNDHGYVTAYGFVHDIDTSSCTEGQMAYSDENGNLITTRPVPPDYPVCVGKIIISHAVSGSIFVDPGDAASITSLTDMFASSKDPTGWVDPNNLIINYSASGRTISLTHSIPGKNIEYMWQGLKKNIGTSWVSPQHPATLDKQYFLFSSDGVTFNWSEMSWAFSDIMVAFVNYGTIDKYCIRETHGLMPWQVHEEFHQIHGTYRISGGTLSNYVLSSTTAANRRPFVTETLIKDEDLKTYNPLLNTALYTRMHLESTGLNIFSKSNSDIIALSGNQPYYNQFTGGTWVQTLVANNEYTTVWLISAPMAADSNSQAYRYIWLQGQSSGSLTSQEALFPSDLNLGFLGELTTEFIFITKLIIRYTSSNWFIVSVSDLTGTRQSTTGVGTSGVYLSAVTTDLSLNGLGTSVSPLSLLNSEGVGFIPNSTVIPVADPVGGGYFYVEAGALKYRGSSGTITTIANA